MSSFFCVSFPKHIQRASQIMSDDKLYDDYDYDYIDMLHDKRLDDDWDRYCQMEEEQVMREIWQEDEYIRKEEEYKKHVRQEHERWIAEHSGKRHEGAALIIQKLWTDWLEKQEAMAWDWLEEEYEKSHSYPHL